MSKKLPTERYEEMVVTMDGLINERDALADTIRAVLQHPGLTDTSKDALLAALAVVGSTNLAPLEDLRFYIGFNSSRLDANRIRMQIKRGQFPRPDNQQQAGLSDDEFMKRAQSAIDADAISDEEIEAMIRKDGFKI